MFPGCKGNVTETTDGYACDEASEETTIDETTISTQDDSGMGGLDTSEISSDLSVDDVATGSDNSTANSETPTVNNENSSDAIS